MRGTLEVALKAYLYLSNQHCSDEAQKAETVLSAAVCYIYIFIIWQAPRAGSMRRILCSDWLPERARWSDTARPGLPVSFPQIKISPKFKRVHESFLSLKLLSAKVKRSFVISLSLWNQKKRQRE